MLKLGNLYLIPHCNTPASKLRCVQHLNTSTVVAVLMCLVGIRMSQVCTHPCGGSKLHSQLDKADGRIPINFVIS